MEKVKLPKSVADSMDYFLYNVCLDKFSMMRVFVEGHAEHFIDGATLGNFASQNPTLAMEALLHGYEAEQTPEERIKGIYDRSVIEHGEIGCQLDEYTTKILIREMLNILGIKIEGVNA